MNYMQTKHLLQLAITTLEDLKASNITTLDTSQLTSIADHMIICSANSSRHAISLANKMVEKAKEHSVMSLGIEGKEQGEWVLIDLGDIIVHIMQPNIREFYALEKLWKNSSGFNKESH